MLEFFLHEKFGELNETQIEALNTMSASNKELLELVQTVLDTYKVKEGEIDLKLETISVKHLLTEIAEEMMPIAQKSNNNIVIQLKTDFNIHIDYLQFKRVIKNLISNAISYGRPDTDIEIKCQPKNNMAEISIKDYGKGIPKEDIEKIFNKYFSAHKKFRKIGTGLGLYLSQKLVKAHNGTLRVSSKDGEWTEFVINLPLT
jgi:signal transduction histidine kinase